MTWIVGYAPPFGLSILVSDVCVTFFDLQGNQEQRDCLQKIYRLDPSIVGGFAGSVRIGFSLLCALQQEFGSAGDGGGWDMDVTSSTWLPQLMRRQFMEASPDEKSLRSSIILASAHPTRNLGDVPWPRTDIHVFRSPDFLPVKAGQFEMLSIGSGSARTRVTELLQQYCSSISFLQSVTMGEHMLAQMLAHGITKISGKEPMVGVSSVFQIGLVQRGRSAIADHEFTLWRGGGKQERITPPPLAKGWQEFERFCRASSLDAATAEC